MKINFFIPIIILFVSACSSKKGTTSSQEKTVAAPLSYETATVTQQALSGSIRIPGELSAYEEVSIYPKVNGYVKNVLVDIGSKVKTGTLLMTLEAPEMTQAVNQAKEKYARTVSDFIISREHFKRLKEASETSGAISPLDLSTAKAKMEADSALSNAELSNWRMQQTMVDYLRVYAPFEGVITERNVHPGALVRTSEKDKPMLELKSIKHLRLKADIPENYVETLKEGDKLEFYVSVFPGKKMTGTVSRRSMNINSQYRMERIEADIINTDESLAPGMYADVVIDDPGNKNAMVVPSTAVITTTERKYVMAVINNKTVKVDVITGAETNNNIQVFRNLKPGEKVIKNLTEDIPEGLTIKD
jgi:RND family efflux transporter MFP subunit